jgi:hypothetical protein
LFSKCLDHFFHVGYVVGMCCHHLNQHESHHQSVSTESTELFLEGQPWEQLFAVAAQASDKTAQGSVIRSQNVLIVDITQLAIGGCEHEVDYVTDWRTVTVQLEVEQTYAVRNARLKGESIRYLKLRVG